MIVNENRMKDELDIKPVEAFATGTGQKMHWYYASNKIGRIHVE